MHFVRQSVCLNQHLELISFLFCLEVVAKLIKGVCVRGIVGLCELINTAIPAK